MPGMCDVFGKIEFLVCKKKKNAGNILSFWLNTLLKIPWPMAFFSFAPEII